MTPLPAEHLLSSATLAGELPRLVRLCAYLTGDHIAAEDLAQDTIAEAWRQRHRLQDTSAAPRWLAAIARNLCLRWKRTHGREGLRQAADFDAHRPYDQPDVIDVELDLERAELASLLDRALARLPPLTRAALIGRYIVGTPLADLAACLGLSEAATAKRLQRGAATLRAMLESDLRPQDGERNDLSGTWRESRMWCTQCGRHRLLGKLPPDSGTLTLRCPGCNAANGAGDIHIQNPGLLRDIKGFKPAFSRVLAETHRRHQAAAAQPCLRCGRALTLRVAPDGTAAAGSGGCRATVLTRRCDMCGSYEQTSLSVRAFALPTVQRFWRDRPRIRTLPERAIESEGSPMIAIGFESLGGTDHMEVLALRETGQIVSIDGIEYRS
jgi:RNA polymerase sigma factor (sigma-70 family)